MNFFIQKFKNLNEINTWTNEVVPEKRFNFVNFFRRKFSLLEEKYNYLEY